MFLFISSSLSKNRVVTVNDMEDVFTKLSLIAVTAVVSRGSLGNLSVIRVVVSVSAVQESP